MLQVGKTMHARSHQSAQRDQPALNASGRALYGAGALTLSRRPLPERMARAAIWGSASGRDSNMTSSTPMGVVSFSKIKPSSTSIRLSTYPQYSYGMRWRGAMRSACNLHHSSQTCQWNSVRYPWLQSTVCKVTHNHTWKTSACEPQDMQRGLQSTLRMGSACFAMDRIPSASCLTLRESICRRFMR